MRSLCRLHSPAKRLLAMLAAVLATAACDREILRDEPRPAGPSLVRAGSSFEDLDAGAVTGMNARGDIVGNSSEGAFRWTRERGRESLTYLGRRASVAGINRAGVAVGSASISNNSGPRAVVWDLNGRVQVLPFQSGWSGAAAVLINDSGVVAGIGDRGQRDVPFRWSAQRGLEVIANAGPYVDRGSETVVYHHLQAINAAGAVLTQVEESCVDRPLDPYCELGDGEWNFPLVWTASGEVVQVGDSYTDVWASSLTDGGRVAGCIEGVPVIWDANGSSRLIGEAGCVMAMSESGVVAGTSVWRTPERAFRWTEAGGMRELGTLGGSHSSAWNVNEAGDVTGWAETATGARRAFLWTEEAGMQALPPLSGSEWSQGHFVSDAREVVGISGTGFSDPRATRWFDVVVNQPPVAEVGVYPIRISGRRYVYSAAGTSDPDGTLRLYWDMNADGTFEGITTTPLFSYVYRAPGTHTLRLVAKDDGDRADTATTTVTVEQNVAPAAAIHGLLSWAAEGALLTATASVTDANQAADSTELRLLRYRWEWSDGYVSTASVSRHRFPDEGSHSIRLIVTDAGGLADTVVRVMPVGNVAPTARFTTPTSIREGTPFTLTASALSDVPADVADGLQVAFNCGGGYGAYGTSLTIVCRARPDQGSVTVGLRVRDQDGGGTGTTRAIPVGNAAPQVTAQATSPTTFAAGGTLSISGGFTDAGAGDAPWLYRIYWGDGAYTVRAPVAAGASITGSHVYPRPGSYQAYVSVVDKDGGSGRSAGIAVTVTP